MKEKIIQSEKIVSIAYDGKKIEHCDKCKTYKLQIDTQNYYCPLIICIGKESSTEEVHCHYFDKF